MGRVHACKTVARSIITAAHRWRGYETVTRQRGDSVS